jgi:hypothetical protein
MWKIKLANRNDSLETISFYSSFTGLNKVLTFSLEPEDQAHHPIEISFVTKKDKNEKNYFIQTGDLIDRNMTITFFNPGIGLSGLKEPMIILENETYFFKVMFNTNLLKDSDSYLLTIEFFIQNK